jgi:hypothetical protein
MKVFAFGTVAMTAVVLAAGCSAQAPVGEQNEAVQGGTVDTTHDFAVGVCCSARAPSSRRTWS